MRILWQLWLSGHIWISIAILWFFLILLYRRPCSGLIFQQVYALQRIERNQYLTGRTMSESTPSKATVNVFAHVLSQATGNFFTFGQSAALLAIYERRNGLFDPIRQSCPECRGLAHYPTIVNQIYPACLTCHGIGFLDKVTQPEEKEGEAEV